MIEVECLFSGVQPALLPGMPDEILWTLCQPIRGHPKGSTVSWHTLSREGYVPHLRVTLRVAARLNREMQSQLKGRKV